MWLATFSSDEERKRQSVLYHFFSQATTAAPTGLAVKERQSSSTSSRRSYAGGSLEVENGTGERRFGTFDRQRYRLRIEYVCHLAISLYKFYPSSVLHFRASGLVVFAGRRKNQGLSLGLW